VIDASNVLLSSSFYENYLNGKNIEECIRIAIQDLNSTDLFMLVDLIFEKIYTNKEYENCNILTMFKLNLRKVISDISMEIQPTNDGIATTTTNTPNIKIYLLIVLKKNVEFFHYFKHINKGEIFSNSKEVYKDNFWKNKPDLHSHFLKMLYIAVDNLCKVRVSDFLIISRI
jgi:hypothetical protein